MGPSLACLLVGLWFIGCTFLDKYLLCKIKGHEADKTWIGWLCIGSVLLITSFACYMAQKKRA